MMENMLKNEDLCVVCLEEKRNAIFYKCGHKITCMRCASSMKIRSNPLKCPLCRQIVVDVIKTYEN